MFQITIQLLTDLVILALISRGQCASVTCPDCEYYILMLTADNEGIQRGTNTSESVINMWNLFETFNSKMTTGNEACTSYQDKACGSTSAICSPGSDGAVYFHCQCVPGFTETRETQIYYCTDTAMSSSVPTTTTIAQYERNATMTTLNSDFLTTTTTEGSTSPTRLSTMTISAELISNSSFTTEAATNKASPADNIDLHATSSSITTSTTTSSATTTSSIIPGQSSHTSNNMALNSTSISTATSTTTPPTTATSTSKSGAEKCVTGTKMLLISLVFYRFLV
ncbi:uncharacterized protein LOC120341985 isoform X2 [Styela clava]